MANEELKTTPLIESGKLIYWADDDGEDGYLIGDGIYYVAKTNMEDNAQIVVDACNAAALNSSSIEDALKAGNERLEGESVIDKRLIEALETEIAALKEENEKLEGGDKYLINLVTALVDSAQVDAHGNWIIDNMKMEAVANRTDWRREPQPPKESEDG